MSEQAATDAKEAVKVKINVQLSKDKFEAYITLTADDSGTPLSSDFILEMLDCNLVSEGIDQDKVAMLAQNPVFGEQITIARGVDSIQGDDAVIKYLFKRSVDLAPKMKEDGTVDFKDLGLIQAVRKGDPLAVKTPRTDGTPGFNVCGKPIPPQPGRDYPLPVGRNVMVSDDKLTLFAEMDGQVVYHNDRVSVLNTYNVDGDVSNATGNIDFNGNVVIKGTVQAGFKIRATGNVEVGGVVEAAEIDAGGDILIRSGFNGGVAGKLKAEGTIMSKFIQAGTVLAGEKVETNYIYNSNVRSKNTVNVIGKGIIVGGSVAARKRIDANIIGNENATKTLVEAGADPEAVQRRRDVETELETIEKNMRSLTEAVTLLSQMKDSGRLPEEKLDQLTKTEEMLEKLKDDNQRLMSEKESLDQRLENIGKGYIGVRGIAYPGVTIKMGPEVMQLKGKYQRTLFMRTDDDIRTGPL